MSFLRVWWVVSGALILGCCCCVCADINQDACTQWNVADCSKY